MIVGMVIICTAAMLLVGPSGHELQLFFSMMLLLAPALSGVVVGWTEKGAGVTRGAYAIGLERQHADGSSLSHQELHQIARIRRIGLVGQAAFALLFFVVGINLFENLRFVQAKQTLIRLTTIGGVALCSFHLLLWVWRWRLCQRREWRIGERPVSEFPEWLSASHATLPDDVSPIDRPLWLYAAPKGKRFWSGVLDLAFLLSAYFWILFVLAVMTETQTRFAQLRFEDASLIACCVGVGVPVLIEILTGRSVGKLLCGLTVRRRDAMPPAPFSLMMRGLIRYLPPCLIILINVLPAPIQLLVPPVVMQWSGLATFLWMVLVFVAVLMPGGRGWYDHLLGTRVFRREAAFANLNVNAFEVQLIPQPAIPVARAVSE